MDFITLICLSAILFYCVYVPFLVIREETEYRKRHRRLNSDAQSIIEFGTIKNKSVHEIIEILDYQEKLEQQDWSKLI